MIYSTVIVVDGRFCLDRAKLLPPFPSSFIFSIPTLEWYPSFHPSLSMKAKKQISQNVELFPSNHVKLYLWVCIIHLTKIFKKNQITGE